LIITRMIGLQRGEEIILIYYARWQHKNKTNTYYDNMLPFT